MTEARVDRDGQEGEVVSSVVRGVHNTRHIGAIASLPRLARMPWGFPTASVSAFGMGRRFSPSAAWALAMRRCGRGSDATKRSRVPR